MNQTQIRDNDAAAQIQEVNYEFLKKNYSRHLVNQSKMRQMKRSTQHFFQQ